MNYRSALLTLWTVLGVTGCATKKLWENSTPYYNTPASNPATQIKLASATGMVVVEYDERNGRTGAIGHRCYPLLGNEERIQKRHKPSFVDPRGLTGDEWKVLPLCPAPLTNVSSCVVITGEEFTVYVDGQLIAKGALPTYSYRSAGETTVCVLLTPLAVVADVSIIGGAVVALIGYEHAKDFADPQRQP